jgi:hypothetical protein
MDWPEPDKTLQMFPREGATEWDDLTEKFYPHENDLMVKIALGMLASGQFRSEDLAVLCGPKDKWRVIARRIVKGKV